MSSNDKNLCVTCPCYFDVYMGICTLSPWGWKFQTSQTHGTTASNYLNNKKGSYFSVTLCKKAKQKRSFATFFMFLRSSVTDYLRLEVAKRKYRNQGLRISMRKQAKDNWQTDKELGSEACESANRPPVRPTSTLHNIQVTYPVGAGISQWQRTLFITDSN